MPRSLTVAQIVDRAQKRANMENSDLLSAAEWKQNLSQVFGELYEEVADSGMRYYETEATISTDGSASYALPDGHLSTIGIDYEENSGRRCELSESMIDERNRYTGSTSSDRAHRYALIGANISLYPTPPSGQSYVHVYVPQPTDLSEASDATSVDLINPSGEAFVVWGMSALAKAKEESDFRGDLMQKDRAMVRLKDWAMKRSLITPRRQMMDENLYDDHYDDRYGGPWPY